MFRVAVVGCGGIGRAHANSWKAAGAEVVCVVDLIEEKAAALAKSVGCGYTADLEALPENLDAVSVTTPPSAHYKVTKRLLERGFNVFCEKPLTLVTEQGEELDALAAKKGLTLAVGFKMRFEPIFIEAKKAYRRDRQAYAYHVDKTTGLQSSSRSGMDSAYRCDV